MIRRITEMKRYENPAIKVSMFRRENILTASGEAQTTAVQLAQADAAKMSADKVFTILAQ